MPLYPCLCACSIENDGTVYLILFNVDGFLSVVALLACGSRRHGKTRVEVVSCLLATTSSGWLVSWRFLGECKRASTYFLSTTIVLVAPFCLSKALTQSDRQKFAAASLGTLYQLVIQSAQTLRGDVAFPELFGPLQRVALKVPTVVCVPDVLQATGSRICMFWPC